MAGHHHEVPTHLNVEDKIVFGLSVRQFLYLLVGSSASYTLWQHFAATGDLVRMSLAALCLATTLAFALMRPAGRPLEEWLAALLVFAATPRHAVWRPNEPAAVDWRLPGATWQELAPSLAWVEEDSSP
jgi:PrgI family protein